MNAYLYVWSALAVVVLVLAAYRLTIGSHEGRALHLLQNDGALMTEQQELSRKIGAVDLWGQLLTVVLAAYGLALLAVFFYHVWFKGYEVQLH